MTAILNQTTKVPAARTAIEIQALLQRHRARSIVVDYDGDGQVVSLGFAIVTQHGERAFRLPANVVGVYRVLYQGKPLSRGLYDYDKRAKARQEHARNVAWRILLRWLESQLAVIQAGLLDLETALLPYLELETGRTLAQELQARAYRVSVDRPSVLLLPAPREE